MHDESSPNMCNNYKGQLNGSKQLNSLEVDVMVAVCPLRDFWPDLQRVADTVRLRRLALGCMMETQWSRPSLCPPPCRPCLCAG